MIFLAVAGPTPFRASRSLCDAVLRSTLAPVIAADGLSPELLDFFLSDAVEPLSDEPEVEAVEVLAVEPPPETATWLWILLMVDCETPAFLRSETLE